MENLKEEKQPFEKKTLTKLLPAAAVIAAVACMGVGASGEETNAVSVAEKGEIVEAGELTTLLKAAYSYDDTGDAASTKKTSSSEKVAEKSTKKKKSGITKGAAKALPAKTAAASGQGQGTTSTPTTQVPENGYKDGVYQGSGTGFGGSISVQVTVSGGKITAVEILDASGETASYLASAKGVISQVLASQSPNVDAVSGATYSSNGIIQAVQSALAQAGNTGNKATVTSAPKKSTETNKNTQKITPTKAPDTSEKKDANSSVQTPEISETAYLKDGTYTASALGFSGDVTITITIAGGRITDISNTNTDTRTFFNRAWRKLQPQILENQSADGIDTVSGATFSSEGILSAAKQAIAKAKAVDTTKVTPTETPQATITPTPEATPEPTEEPEATPVPTEAPEATPVPDDKAEVPPAPEGETEVTPTPEETPDSQETGGLVDGTYTGCGYGFESDRSIGLTSVRVTITVSGGKIVSTSCDTFDTDEYFDVAWVQINQLVLDKQTTEGVDTVGGATYSSQGILEAFASAIEQAKGAGS